MSTPLPAPAAPAPAVTRIVLAHAQRGITLQLALRGVLALFVVGTLVLLPPPVGAQACAVIAAGYVLAVLALTVWLARGGPSAIAWGWLGLYVDLLALSALALIADRSADLSWTSYVLLGGFFLLPVLAATQLRWRVCVGVVVPTVAFYAAEAIATRQANDEPWASVVLRVLVLAGVGAAAIGLCRIQLSRVRAIERLVADRTQLLAELMTVTDRERRSLAEDLHDGALQYILAARLDLDDARDTADPQAFDRLDEALGRSSRLLRSTVADLHPAVLARSGLADAVSALARPAAERGKFALTLEVGGWPAEARTSADLLLFGAARELLANVVKHARAGRVLVRLSLDDDRATLVVADDGAGLTGPAAAAKLAQGHIGLASQRVRIESAGGTLRIAPGNPGAVVTVSVPYADAEPDAAAAARTTGPRRGGR